MIGLLTGHTLGQIRRAAQSSQIAVFSLTMAGSRWSMRAFDFIEAHDLKAKFYEVKNGVGDESAPHRTEEKP